LFDLSALRFNLAQGGEQTGHGRDKTGLNRLNVFCQMSARHRGLGRLPTRARDAEKVPHEPTSVT
jgi:hypothetical protein